MVLFFKAIFQIYYDFFQGKSILEKLKPMEQYTQDMLLYRLDLVGKMLERLNYNVNINLLLDAFVLGLEE